MKVLKYIFLFAGMLVVKAQAIDMPAIFSSNMVLQQNREVSVWGKANPNSVVELTASWGTQAKATADKDGKWQTKIQTTTAGGPYTLIIKTASEILEFKNILLGEVWFCSGQSNMEMPLQGWPPGDLIVGSEKEIAAADYPEMRLFTVAREVSFDKRDDCSGQWSVCTPQTAQSFSATAFFFGKKLHKELGVPVGLIHSSWGGTPVEAWMDKETLSQFREFQPLLSNIDNSRSEWNKLQSWLDELPQIKVSDSEDDKWQHLNFKDSRASQPEYDDSKWPEMKLPTLWEYTDLGQFDGVVWFRKNIDLPVSFLKQDIEIELGPIDDVDITYLNGTKIGGHEKDGEWQVNRVYKIPGGLLKEKNNVIAVRVIDSQGGGGIYGNADQMRIYPVGKVDQEIKLTGNWKFMPVAEYRGRSFYVYNLEELQYQKRPQVSVELGPNTPGTLFNGMVNPVVPYTIRGAIWYQGESNTGRAKQYQALFPAMIRNWRKVWGLADFPFYFVQIAPYDYGSATASQELREAQFKTLNVPNTGMAVTLDIGNPKNIHPGNKHDVGERLAFWALAKDHGINVDFSGPLYKSMQVKDGKIVISFDYSEGLQLKDLKTGQFIIAGKDKDFMPADVNITDDELVVSSDKIKNPVAVRYLWDNTSEASLFNKAGLPASSFRTDDWQ